PSARQTRPVAKPKHGRTPPRLACPLHLTLPALAGPAEAGRPGRPHRPSNRPWGPEGDCLEPTMTSSPDPPSRVLVVEDNPDTRRTLRILLELRGFQVQEAPDGQEGVRQALEWHPDVAVVDIGLPVLDGYEVARRVRAALDRRTLLIALTAYGR